MSRYLFLPQIGDAIDLHLQAIRAANVSKLGGDGLAGRVSALEPFFELLFCSLIV